MRIICEELRSPVIVVRVVRSVGNDGLSNGNRDWMGHSHRVGLDDGDSVRLRVRHWNRFGDRDGYRVGHGYRVRPVDWDWYGFLNRHGNGLGYSYGVRPRDFHWVGGGYWVGHVLLYWYGNRVGYWYWHLRIDNKNIRNNFRI